jgi:hypothetical protein
MSLAHHDLGLTVALLWICINLVYSSKVVTSWVSFTVFRVPE